MFLSWIENAQPLKAPKKPTATKKVAKKSSKAHIYIAGASIKGLVKSVAEEHQAGWDFDVIAGSEREITQFQGSEGPVWVLNPAEPRNVGHEGLLDESLYAKGRDFAGTVAATLKASSVSEVHVHFVESTEDLELGFFTGLEMATYSFKDTEKVAKSLISKNLFFEKKTGEIEASTIEKARLRALSANIARHMVNLPPNLKTPDLFVNIAKSLKFSKSSTVTVWDEKKLKTEKCHLLLAVGQGSTHGPKLLKISYRPKKKSSQKPIAFVGKGITFDTGGLDIKPSAAMRMMKKDMGGAASTLALAYWVDKSQYEHPVDFYLALAENAVDGNAMRPGDVYTSRAGFSVEIDNTDAEGRLVLADALDVAVTAQASPELVIDMATLTGACRVALGVELSGLFSNDDELANELSRAGQKAGDMNWRLPLMERYFAAYGSAFADMKNAGESFGGAITAALFLQRFVKGKKWAHLDMYSWTEKPIGPFHAAGGNAQSVQALITWLEGRT